jgi:hypothetical protein
LATAAQAGTLGASVRVTFTERENHESGFKRVFDKEIASGLATLETERQRLKRNRTLRLLLAFAVAVVLIGGSIIFFQEQGAVIGIAVVVAIVGGFLIVGSPTDKFRAKVRDLVMPAVTKFLGIAYSRTVPADFEVREFTARNLVGSYQSHRSRLQDHVSGAHDGRRYAMIEAHLQRKSGKSTVTVFQGVLMIIDWPEAGQADVLIGRDWGKILNKLAGIAKADRVTFDNAAFEKMFEVYASDPAAARQLLTPAFLDSMVALAESRKGQPPTAAFGRGRLLLALPLREELFETGSLSRSLEMFEEDLHKLLRQLTMPCRVIDVLHGQKKQIL